MFLTGEGYEAYLVSKAHGILVFFRIARLETIIWLSCAVLYFMNECETLTLSEPILKDNGQFRQANGAQW